MSENNENESEKFAEENKPSDLPPSTEKPHRMRLSIDIHSLKDAEFRGLIYVRYSSIASIGIKQFKTLPALEILKSSEGSIFIMNIYISLKKNREI